MKDGKGIQSIGYRIATRCQGKGGRVVGSMHVYNTKLIGRTSELALWFKTILHYQLVTFCYAGSCPFGSSDTLIVL